jgi:DNA-binding CsgD family transcriptional regulator
MSINKEVLEDLYLKQNKTIKEISRLLDIKESTIRSQMHKYNIRKGVETIQII